MHLLITRRITRVVIDAPCKDGTYVDHMKNYHSSLLIPPMTLVTHENSLMEREERLRRNEIDLMAKETPG